MWLEKSARLPSWESSSAMGMGIFNQVNFRKDRVACDAVIEWQHVGQRVSVWHCESAWDGGSRRSATTRINHTILPVWWLISSEKVQSVLRKITVVHKRSSFWEVWGRCPPPLLGALLNPWWDVGQWLVPENEKLKLPVILSATQGPWPLVL